MSSTSETSYSLSSNSTASKSMARAQITSAQIVTSVDDAATMLTAGKLLAYPTESVWGIGCDAYDEKAVQRILAIKRRPIEKGMIVITDDSDRLAPLLAPLTKSQRQQVLTSWQTDSQMACAQAHSWLLPIPKNLKTIIPAWITGEHTSVAVRVIAHPLIQALCQKMVSRQNPFGFIVSTSCNPSGYAPAATLAEAYAYFGEEIGYLKAVTLGYTWPSQIRDAITGRIIR